VWSKREKTEEGASLLELVEHGMNRVKYASDCVVAVVKEIKAHSTQGRPVFQLSFVLFVIPVSVSFSMLQFSVHLSVHPVVKLQMSALQTLIGLLLW
jgi:uncharacterized membrane protein